MFSVLAPFVERPVRTHYPDLGASQTLKCTPPHSYLIAEIFWAKVDERITSINLTDRVSMDLEGMVRILIFNMI